MLIAGVDEVGRGPLAGAVVAAAVILKEPINGLTDSKKLTPKKRKSLSLQIKNEAIAYAYGRADVEEIDALNIHHATLLAMQRAVELLSIIPDHILVDGAFRPQFNIPCHAIIKGDDLIPEISAASILAKVYRDEEMDDLDLVYPGYGFANHKGYGTVFHQEALNRLGPCKIHRLSFGKVKTFVSSKLNDYS